MQLQGSWWDMLGSGHVRSLVTRPALAVRALDFFGKGDRYLDRRGALGKPTFLMLYIVCEALR